MAEFPALPLWTDAYLGDTSHLTTMEHGAYLLLLIVAWRSKDTRLPDDDKLLARYTRCTVGQWKKLRPILEPFFKVEGGFWMQGRLNDEAKAVRSKKEAAAANGRASALKRQGRHSTERERSDSGASTKNQLNHNHNHIPFSNENGASPDSDRQFWDTAKAFIGKPSLVGKWVRDHGKIETARAITAAQIERAVEPIAYVEGYFRKNRVEGGLSVPC